MIKLNEPSLKSPAVQYHIRLVDVPAPYRDAWAFLGLMPPHVPMDNGAVILESHVEATVNG